MSYLIVIFLIFVFYNAARTLRKSFIEYKNNKPYLLERDKFKNQLQIELLKSEKENLSNFIKNLYFLKNTNKFYNFPKRYFDYKSKIICLEKKIIQTENNLIKLKNISVAKNDIVDQIYLKNIAKSIKLDIYNIQLNINEMEGYNKGEKWYSTTENLIVQENKLNIIESKIINRNILI